MQHTHSSTIATNAVIERRGPKIGVLVTEGFRDLFELQRLAVPDPLRFDSHRPTPLVPREQVGEVRERIDAQRRVVEPLDTRHLLETAQHLVDIGCESLVVCFLHSYVNDAHESLARDALRQQFPNVPIETSADIWPQAREYERATLTVINASIRPVMEEYLDEIASGMHDLGLANEATVARSNGGMQRAHTTREWPVGALLSGPAAGVAGAARAAADSGWVQADLITIDMGGTSADIGVVRMGLPLLSSEETIAHMPVLVPTIAVSAIGAGGGSVVWLDELGNLKVGPRSLGADPGPASYGNQSGTPALTDAFLVAGWLSPDRRLGGQDRPLPGKRQGCPCRRCIEDRSGCQLGRDSGRGDSHCHRNDGCRGQQGAVASRGRRSVLPPSGVWWGGTLDRSASRRGDLHRLGSHTSDSGSPQRGWSRNERPRRGLGGTYLLSAFGNLGRRTWSEHGTPLEEQCSEWISRERGTLPVTATSVTWSLEMRYEGQGFDVNVPIEEEWLAAEDRGSIANAFHNAHESTFGHSSPDIGVWLKELRAHILCRVSKPSVGTIQTRSDVSSARLGEREIRVNGQVHTAVVYNRAALEPGFEFTGPAIVEQMDTTVLVPEGWHAHVDLSGSLQLRRY